MVHIIARQGLLGLVLMSGLFGCGKEGAGLKSGAGAADGAVNATGGIASGGAGTSADGGIAPGGAGVGGSRLGSTDGGSTNGGATGNRATSANGGISTGGAAGNRTTSTAGGGTTGGAAGNRTTSTAGGVTTGGGLTTAGGVTTASCGLTTASGGLTTGGVAGHQSTSLVGGSTGTAGVAGTNGSSKGGASGTGEASLVLDRSRLDFDTITLGTTIVETFTLTNRGGDTSGLPNINVSPVRGSAAKAITVKGCTAALAPGASCTFTVTVTPSTLGLLEGYVYISADPGTHEYGLDRISLFVVGWAVGFEVASPANIDLGTVTTGTTVQQNITVSALIPLTDLTVKASGDSLSLDTSASTCTATLAQGTTCVVVLVFNAATVGWKEGGLNIKAGGDMGQIAVIRVTANVSNANDLSVDPKAPAPYACVFEETSAPVVFTITNTGSAPSGDIVATLTGGTLQDFRISENTCTTLAPQATCTVSVVCSPPMSASAATRKAILSISDGNTHLAVPVSGEITMP